MLQKQYSTKIRCRNYTRTILSIDTMSTNRVAGQLRLLKFNALGKILATKQMRAESTVEFEPLNPTD